MEAVIGEPVSARLFPVPREDTGKFADLGLEMTEAPRPSGRKLNRLRMEFPDCQSRENLWVSREPQGA